MELSWLCCAAEECVPIFTDATNGILSLQRDLHAIDFALCEDYTFGIRTLSFPCLSEKVLLCSKSTFRVCVWTVGIALFQTVHIGFCLPRQCILPKFGMMTLSVHVIVLWACRGGDK